MIKKKNIELFLFFFIVVLFFYSYFSKLYFQLEHIDEVNYLSDSLLLFEGMVPSSKHAPSGLTTWVGTIYLIIEYIYYFFNFNVSSIAEIFSTFDYVIYKNYKDLTNIKLSLLVLNSSLLIYFIYKDKEKIFFYIFLFIFTIFFLIIFSLSGKPFFTASLFGALALLVKENNRKLALIFFGLCIAENISFLVIIFYLLKNTENKIDSSMIFFPFVIFLAVAPWWLISIFQNIKIQLNFIISSNNFSENLLGNYLSFLCLAFYIFSMIVLPFLNKVRLKLILILITFLIIIFLVEFQGFYLRWFLPLFLVLSFEISKFQFASKFFFKISILIAIFINLIVFNFSNFKSDIEILSEEKNSNYRNVLSNGLLVEELDFKKYVSIQQPYLRKYNIKNINYFNDQKAPLSFSESGNLEKLYLRRYEYLTKYSNNISKKSKFIRYSTGLKSDEIYWCNKLSPENISIIYLKKIKTCDDIR
tara:strand:+ start:1168 stop:2589 length:1422 start_codon:yes stop_codon:yes gene_type:complete